MVREYHFGFRNYPYQNLNDLNLDYVLRVARAAEETLRDLGNYSERVKDLEEAIEAIERGDLTPGLANSIVELVQKNVISLVGDMVKFVFFGLTDDGYFVAYIPEPWNDILFNTSNWDIFLPNVPEFGRLILSY